MIQIRHIAILAIGAALTACGGGGAGEGSQTQARFDYPSITDTSFATSGYSIQSTGLPVTSYLANFNVSDFIVDSQGRIVVVGSRTSANREAWIMRMLADGTPDPTCGSKGWSSFTTGGPATPQRVRQLPDGRYVLGGYLGSPSVWAVNSTNCSVDTSFGVQGKAQVPSPSATEIQDGVIGMEVDGVGRITATVASTLSGKLLVARFLSTGQVDTSFGTSGYAQISAPAGASPKPWTLAIRPDGRILVAASMQYNTQTGYWAGLVQLLANGQVDTSFGDAGFVSQRPTPNLVALPKALVILNDGSAVESGLTQPGVLVGTVIGVDAYWLKVDATGKKDTGFQDGGLTIRGAAPAGRKDSSNYVTAMISQDGSSFLSCQNWINVTKVSNSSEPGFLQALVQKRSSTGQLASDFGSGGTGWLPRADDLAATCIALRKTPEGRVLALLDYGPAESAVAPGFAVARVR